MTDTREHPPPTTASAPPAAAIAATQPGRIIGLDGIRGLAALFVVLNHIFERAWPGYPANPAPFGRTVSRAMHAAGSPLRLRTRTALPPPLTGM
jgi:hypothetical protein